MSRRLLALIAVVLTIAVAAPAGAHVTVNPGEAAKGGFAKLSFRVPTESAGASTVKVSVQFPDPATAPLAFASVQPHPGWTYAIEKQHLATPVASDDGEVTDVVSVITWTAVGPGIAPGEFDEFSVSVGPLPTKVDTLVFKAVQTYSDGTVVRWIEEAQGSDEPAHPAMVLRLTSDASTPAASDAAEGTDDEEGDDGGDTLAIVGTVLGGLALVVGLGALLIARRPRNGDQ